MASPFETAAAARLGYHRPPPTPYARAHEVALDRHRQDAHRDDRADHPGELVRPRPLLEHDQPRAAARTSRTGRPSPQPPPAVLWRPMRSAAPDRASRARPRGRRSRRSRAAERGAAHGAARREQRDRHEHQRARPCARPPRPTATAAPAPDRRAPCPERRARPTAAPTRLRRSSVPSPARRERAACDGQDQPDGHQCRHLLAGDDGDHGREGPLQGAEGSDRATGRPGADPPAG